MDAFFDKLILALIASILGILGAVITPRFLDWRKRVRLQKSLLSELENLKAQLRLLHQHLKYDIKSLILGVWEMQIPMKTSNPIYSNFYKEICEYLNAEQRLSFGIIHGMVESTNRLTDRLSELSYEVQRDAKSGHLTTALHLTIAQYENILMLDFYIGNHLRNSENPGLDGDSNKRAEFKEKNAEIQGDINLIIADAQKLDAEKFRSMHSSTMTIEVERPNDLP